MLLSMTGFGEARLQTEKWTVEVEIRTVNNRHLKVTTKISDAYVPLEAEFERLVREWVRRGSVQLSIRVDRPHRSDDYQLNIVALQSYAAQFQTLRPPGSGPVDPLELIGLPGVVAERRPEAVDPHEDWPTLQGLVTDALKKLQTSRTDEGKAMAAELLALCDYIGTKLAGIADRAPCVVSAYADRLTERVRGLVESKGVTIEARDLIREVAIFAERADIAEEITRLRAHLAQFREVLQEKESAGRKLEFVVQEMGRETNTIGSKANDVEISRDVVEIKGTLEKIRELIQNVE